MVTAEAPQHIIVSEAWHVSDMDELDLAERTRLVERVRAAHRAYPTGVSVVSTSVDGRPYGLLVNSFTSVTLDPPTLLFCVHESSRTHDHLARAKHATVNVLAHDQADIARAFADSRDDKFAEVDWVPCPQGSPLLTGVAAHFEVVVVDAKRVGTHTVFFCEVVEAEDHGREPLTFLHGELVDGVGQE